MPFYNLFTEVFALLSSTRKLFFHHSIKGGMTMSYPNFDESNFASLYLKFSFFNLSFNCRSRKSLIEKDGKVILSKFFKILKCSNIYYNYKGYKDKFTSFFKNNSPHPPYFSFFPLLPIFLNSFSPFRVSQISRSCCHH